MIIHISKNIIKTAIVLCVLFGVLLSVFAVRLAAGPIPLAWAVPWISDTLAREGGIATSFSVGDLSLAWNTQTNRLEFSGQQVKVTQANSPLTAVDQVGMTFSVFALLRGELYLKDLWLRAPRFQFTFNPNSKAGESGWVDFRALDQLRSVTILGGEVMVHDTRTQAQHSIHDLSVTWRRNLWSSNGLLTAKLTLSGSETAVPITAEIKQANNQTRMTVMLRDADGSIPISTTLQKTPNPDSWNLVAEIPSLTTQQLRRWWPAGAAPGAILWLNENLKDGTIQKLHAHATILEDGKGGYDLSSLDAGWNMDNLSTTFLPGFPVVTGIHGKAVMNKDQIEFDLSSGNMAGDVVLQPGKMTITGLRDTNQILSMDIPITAQLPTVLKLLDTPPYGYAKKMGINAATASGGVGAHLNMQFPLLAALKISEIEYNVTANLADVALPKALMGYDITRGQGVLTLTPADMNITGQADLAGIPLQFMWQDFAKPQENLSRKIDFSGQLGEGDHARLKLPTAGYVTGATTVAGTYTVRSGQNKLSAQMRLDGAGFQIRELGFQKPAGSPMTILADITLGKAAITDFRLEASGAGIRVRGSGQLDANLNPIAFQFPTITLGKRNDFALALQTLDNQQRWRITGAAMDGGAWLSEDQDTAHAAAPARTIQMQIANLYLANQKRMENVRAELTYQNDSWEKVILSGVVRPGALVDLRWDLRNPTQKLKAETADTGALLSAFNISNAMIGGKLLAESVPDNTAGLPLTGKATIKNFRMREIPLLGRLIAAVSPGGLLDTLRGKDGVAFDKFETAFTYDAKTLSLKGARASGQSLGIMAEGDIQHADSPQTLSLNGTIVPLYAVNNALSGIPLLGDLLSGKDGSGLIAFNYSASGPLADPKVRVNPLSALTPGFLRDLFFESAAPEKSNTSSP